MIPLTEGQLTYLDIILSLILFILATYIIDKWGRKEKYTIREKIVVPLLAIATIFLIGSSFITDLRLNKPTVTTTTTMAKTLMIAPSRKSSTLNLTIITSNVPIMRLQTRA